MTPDHATPDATGPHLARILVGEDDDDLRRVLATSLELAGYSVLQARDGAELLDFLCSAPPGFFDLVVCDNYMPGAQGMHCLSMARTRAPFVILSGRVDEGMRADAARLGAARILEKPVDLADLLDVVDGVVWSPTRSREPSPRV